MKYLTKNYLDKGDFTKAQGVIENLKSEIKSIIAEKEESKNTIKNNNKNYNNNLKNNNYNPEKQKIIGGDKLAEILEILKNVPRVAKLRIKDPLVIKTAYGYKLLKERSKKTREALKKAKRGEIFVHDDYIDPELPKIKKYVNEIEKNMDEQTSIIEQRVLDDTEIVKNKELKNFVDLILKYYEKQLPNLFENKKLQSEGNKLINKIGEDIIKLLDDDKIWQIFLLINNLTLYEECIQNNLHNGNGFNFYLKVQHLFTENKNLPDRRISSLVYKKKGKPIYYYIVGFHLFRINDNFKFKKDFFENLEKIKIYEKNTLPKIDFKIYEDIKKSATIKNFIKYLEKQKEILLNKNHLMQEENFLNFNNEIYSQIERINDGSLIREIKDYELNNSSKIKEKIKETKKELSKLKIKEIDEEEPSNIIENTQNIFSEFIELNEFLLKIFNQNQSQDSIKRALKEKIIEFNNLYKEYEKALVLLNEIYEFILDDYEFLKIIEPNEFEKLEPVKFNPDDQDPLWKMVEQKVHPEKISYIQDKIRDQVKSFKEINRKNDIDQPKCEQLFNIDFDEQTEDLNYKYFKIDEDDLEIKKLINIQKNIKKHTDDIIDLYQNIDSLGKGPVKDIDDKDIKFSTNLLKQYVDKQILKGEKIKDIRRNFYKKIKRIKQNDNDKYYLDKLEKLIAEGEK